jgi:hypothetical protein
MNTLPLTHKIAICATLRSVFLNVQSPQLLLGSFLSRSSHHGVLNEIFYDITVRHDICLHKHRILFGT